MMNYLAFDGGGTRTRAALYDGDRKLLAESSAGPSNPVDIGVAGCVEVLAGMGAGLRAAGGELLEAVVGGIAGAASVALREAVARGLSERLGAARTLVTSDLFPVLWANAFGESAILAIAGTGSSVLAKTANGEQVLIGGRGALFGDEGSAYQIAVSALRASAYAVDGLGPETGLVDAIPRSLGVAAFADVTRWTHTATKREVANLAPAVTRLAEEGDRVAQECVATQAERLATQVTAAGARLSLPLDSPVFLTGGVFEHCARFRAEFENALGRLEPALRAALPKLRGPRAVVELAWLDAPALYVSLAVGGGDREGSLVRTEQVFEAERSLDELSAREMVARMNQEDRRVAEAVSAEAPNLAAVIEAGAEAIQCGGRIIYVGAGTSGRLGVLDASECPPTFGVSVDRVVGIIAGGERALRESVEGAEDDAALGAADLRSLTPAVSAKDLVVGIAASGTTPYVRGALAGAQAQGARTALVCGNLACRDAADLVVAVDTGAEVLAGSTRLKAGTAAKLVLNMISTGALTLSGYVYRGEMVGMRPSNAKLRRRAARIVGGLGGVNEARASALLEEASGDIAVAVVMARRDVAVAVARECLRRAGSLRGVLG